MPEQRMLLYAPSTRAGSEPLAAPPHHCGPRKVWSAMEELGESQTWEGEQTGLPLEYTCPPDDLAEPNSSPNQTRSSASRVAAVALRASSFLPAASLVAGPEVAPGPEAPTLAPSSKKRHVEEISSDDEDELALQAIRAIEAKWAKQQTEATPEIIIRGASQPRPPVPPFEAVTGSSASGSRTASIQPPTMTPATAGEVVPPAHVGGQPSHPSRAAAQEVQRPRSNEAHVEHLAALASDTLRIGRVLEDAGKALQHMAAEAALGPPQTESAWARPPGSREPDWVANALRSERPIHEYVYWHALSVNQRAAWAMLPTAAAQAALAAAVFIPPLWQNNWQFDAFHAFVKSLVDRHGWPGEPPAPPARECPPRPPSTPGIAPPQPHNLPAA